MFQRVHVLPTGLGSKFKMVQYGMGSHKNERDYSRLSCKLQNCHSSMLLMQSWPVWLALNTKKSYIDRSFSVV